MLAAVARLHAAGAIAIADPGKSAPPAGTLTSKQELFIGGQFSGLKQIKHDARCRNVSLP